MESDVYECTIDDFGVDADGFRSKTNDFNDNGGVATTTGLVVVGERGRTDGSFGIDVTRRSINVEFDEAMENEVENMSRKVTSGANKC